MSAQPPPDRPPRPVPFVLYGTVAGLLAALTAGELVWAMLGPPAPAEAHTEPPVAPNPNVGMAVTAARKVSVYPGGKNAVGVRAARDRFDGPVTVNFAGLPFLSAVEITVPAGGTTGETEVAAAPSAKPGTYTLTASARAVADGRALSATTTVEVTVLPVPPPPPRLAVAAAPKVQAYQRGKNTFAVRVARGEFDGDVEVSFDRLPDGVTIPALTVPAGQTEATAELTAEGSTKTGRHPFGVTARGGPKTNPATATAESAVEVRGSPMLPADVVLVLDCTRSMEKALAGIAAGTPRFAAELAKAQLDARFGLVGFQDTTLGQPLKTPLLDGERLTADATRLRAAVERLKLGGGGGEGASSLDGLATAAEYPFRPAAARVLLLVTDDGPKRIDGFVKGSVEAVKFLKEKKIDQLHVVALPEHRKHFEPLGEGAKGTFFDLHETNKTGAYDKLMTDLGRAVWESLPALPENRPEPSAAAPAPALPPVGPAKVPAPPPAAEPEAPKVESPATPVTQPGANPEPSRGGPAPAAAWAVAVAALACLFLLLGQAKFLPGGATAVGYGGGLVAGLAAGAAGYFALEPVAGAFAARLVAGSALGLCAGLVVALAYHLFRPKSLEPEAKSDAPARAAVPTPSPSPAPTSSQAAPIVKPNIAAPRPADGCPGCGRKIPGAAGTRYCMLCNKTY